MFEIRKIANNLYALFDVVLGMVIDTGSKRSMELLANIITNDGNECIDEDFDR